MLAFRGGTDEVRDVDVREEHAKRVISKELGLEFVLHDTNGRQEAYDLRYGPEDAPEIAVECTGAHDQEFTNLVAEVGRVKRLKLNLEGDWSVGLRRGAKVREVEQSIEAALQRCEREGLNTIFPAYYSFKAGYPDLYDLFDELSIDNLLRCTARGRGHVYLTPESVATVVDELGAKLPGWIGSFLRDPKRKKHRAKLRRSNAPEQHFYVEVPFGGDIPPAVEAYLMTETEQLPAEHPSLPECVTGVWVVSDWSAHGVRWDSSGWHRFAATL